MNPIKVGIVDDNKSIANEISKRLAMFPEIEIIFYEDRGQKALNWLNNHSIHPAVILMDIEMPVMDGIETTFRIKQQYPGIHILMLTVFDDEDTIYRAMQAGAKGYLLKEERAHKMIQAFTELTEGGIPMSASIASKTMKMMLEGYTPDKSRVLSTDPSKQLSKRETEILELLSAGHKNAVVAQKLFISEATVKKHIENIYQKVEARGRVELINWYNKEKAR